MKTWSSYHEIHYMQKLSQNEPATGFHLGSGTTLRQVWTIHVPVPHHSSKGMRPFIPLLEDKWTRKVTRLFSCTSIITTTTFLLTSALETLHSCLFVITLLGFLKRTGFEEATNSCSCSNLDHTWPTRRSRLLSQICIWTRPKAVCDIQYHFLSAQQCALVPNSSAAGRCVP